MLPATLAVTGLVGVVAQELCTWAEPPVAPLYVPEWAVAGRMPVDVLLDTPHDTANAGPGAPIAAAATIDRGRHPGGTC
jgi:hypothetical protein